MSNITKQQSNAAGLTEDELDTLKGGEADASKTTDADKAAGADKGAADAGAKVEAKAGGDEDGGKKGDDEKQGQAADQQNDEREERFVPKLTEPKPPENHEARLKEIRTEKAAALKKMYDGEMSAEDYAELEDKLSSEADGIKESISRQKFATEFNGQMTQQHVELTRKNYLKVAGKRDGIDYADEKVRSKFDRAFTLLAQDPDHANKPLEEIESVFEAAHDMVRAMLGKTVATTNTSKVADIRTATKRDVPTTLAGLPAAADNRGDDETMNAARNLEGEDLERMLAGQSRGEVQRLLKKAS